MRKDFIVGGFIAMFLVACCMSQQSWDGSAKITLTDGRTAHCPDGVVTTPAAVACYTSKNRGQNIFTILKSEIQSIEIGG